MMSNNKILTVSYGTFSCTLEGFDDSFDTMKAIAEYFRDLAADDRYFGAEPPQPDAEMLARIAEREIARRVEARFSDSGIHLRAGAAATALTAGDIKTAPLQRSPEAQAAPAHDTAETAETAKAPGQDGTEATAPVVQPSSAASDPEPTAAATEDGSASEISAAAGKTPTTRVMQQGGSQPALDDDVEQPAEATNLSVSEAEANVSDDLADKVEDAAEFGRETSDDVAAQFMAQKTEEEIPVAEPLPAHHAGRPTPNSIADKLQRIRAVVSKSHVVPTSFSEDEHAEDIVEEQDSETTHTIADFFAQGSDAPVAEDDAEPAEPIVQPASEHFATETEIEPVEADELSEAAVADHPVAATEDEEDEDADLVAALARLDDEYDAAGTVDVTAGEPGIETDDAGLGDESDEHEYDFSALFEDDEDDADEETAESLDTDADAAMEPDAAVVRARVIKVKRSEIRAALDAGMLEEDDSDEGDTAQDRESSGAYVLQDVAAADEDELDRLMAEADQQMDEADSTNRRLAFNQLRGAVEATLADEKLGREDDTDDADEYRSDLAAAVRPRRPVPGAQADRPRDQRPAPLKLVAEQRVDISATNSGPVQPRRVAASAHGQQGSSDSGFADYAAARGAKDLPELLEAAASYLSFVEGCEQFSRPQLMTKVRQIDPDGFSREDGLRHFGKLLRAGKIEKIKGGRFTVSDEIGFRPDGERAAS